jgi:two-component system, chemotaxis family, chemotaxis protein CheY
MAKAMVIDDSKAIRMILSRSLNKLGYEVCTASNGREALEIIDQGLPELAFCLVDWNMPEMNGIEFVRLLRRRALYSDTPLMMVTTETEIEQMSAALEAGADEYVMKPFTEEIIADKLRLMGVME